MPGLPPLSSLEYTRRSTRRVRGSPVKRRCVITFFRHGYSQILDTKTENADLVSSFATLSTFYTENNVNARRHLRSTVENESLKVDEEFVKVAGNVVSTLENVQRELQSISKYCDEINSALVSNKNSSASLHLETSRLQHALRVSEVRSSLIETFLQQYQLDASEISALQSEIAPAFFDALSHVQKVHANCKQLLKTHHHRGGLELLDSMASLQEAAYERLCRWVQNECQVMANTNSDIHPLLQRAVVTLRPRQVLFSYCMEEISTARQLVIYQRFIQALTQGTRPIEMHASDPWRYVNDMLAWVHSAAASERDLFWGILHDKDEYENGTGTLKDSPSEELSTEADSLLPKLLDTVFEGLSRPLKIRIEQILMANLPPLINFQLSHLLTFYLLTVLDVLGADSRLTEVLKASRAMATRVFHEQLRSRGDKILRYIQNPTKDLSIPATVGDGVDLAADLIAAHESSLLGSMEATWHKEALENDNLLDMEAILREILDPLVKATEISAEALNPKAASRLDDGIHLHPADQYIYRVNCLQAVQRPLLGHSCAVKYASSLKELEDKQLNTLTKIEAERVLKMSGLLEISERLRLYQETRTLGGQDYGSSPSDDAALSPARISEVMLKFFSCLSDPSALPQFDKLLFPAVKAQASQRSLNALAKAYEEVYNSLLDPRNGFSEPKLSSALRHTPSQVRTLLGVDAV